MTLTIGVPGGITHDIIFTEWIPAPPGFTVRISGFTDEIVPFTNKLEKTTAVVRLHPRHSPYKQAPAEVPIPAVTRIASQEPISAPVLAPAPKKKQTTPKKNKKRTREKPPATRGRGRPRKNEAVVAAVAAEVEDVSDHSEEEEDEDQEEEEEDAEFTDQERPTKVQKKDAAADVTTRAPHPDGREH